MINALHTVDGRKAFCHGALFPRSHIHHNLWVYSLSAAYLLVQRFECCFPSWYGDLVRYGDFRTYVPARKIVCNGNIEISC